MAGDYDNDCVRPDAVLSTLLARLPGAGEYATKLELHNTMTEFFRQTLAWQHSFRQETNPGQAVYSLGIPSKAQLATMLFVRSAQGPYQPKVQDFYPRDDSARRFFSVEPTETAIRLNPTPAATPIEGDLEVFYSLAPAPESIDIPRPLAQRYQNELIDGTLARMLSHVNRPYFNQRQALYFERKFRFHISRTRRSIKTANTRAGVLPRHPRIAQGGNQFSSPFPGGA